MTIQERKKQLEHALIQVQSNIYALKEQERDINTNIAVINQITKDQEEERAADDGNK